MGLSFDPNSCGSLAENNLIAKMKAGNKDIHLINGSISTQGSKR